MAELCVPHNAHNVPRAIQYSCRASFYSFLCHVMFPHLQNILEDVNREVKQATKHYRLMEYQSKLDTSALEKSSSKLVSTFKVGKGMGSWPPVYGYSHNVHSMNVCYHLKCH